MSTPRKLSSIEGQGNTVHRSLTATGWSVGWSVDQPTPTCIVPMDGWLPGWLAPCSFVAEEQRKSLHSNNFVSKLFQQIKVPRANCTGSLNACPVGGPESPTTPTIPSPFSSFLFLVQYVFNSENIPVLSSSSSCPSYGRTDARPRTWAISLFIRLCSNLRSFA